MLYHFSLTSYSCKSVSLAPDNLIIVVTKQRFSYAA